MFRPTFNTPLMKRSVVLLACVFALLSAGCSREPKEVSDGVKAEAATMMSEAQFALSIREYSRAEELIRKALDLRDDVPEYWVSLGMVRCKQDDKSGARPAYEKALKLHTARFKKDRQPEELAQQAFVLGLLGKTDEALKLLADGLKEFPDSAVMKKMADPRGLPRTFKTEEFKSLMI
jgi:tetratricopeptide (TPR) repeat protein